MDEKTRQLVGAALGRIPQGLFILTAQHEDRRAAMVASWVQQASFTPPMVSVAVGKGRPILPLISESRFFGLCQVGAQDRLLLKHFGASAPPGDDPFLGLELLGNHHQPRVPILIHSLTYLECEVVRHVDVEGDHDIFVGTVRSAGSNPGAPHVHLREDGLKY